MKRSWARRATELHDELAAIASDDPRWWLLAGGAAVTEPWRARPGYVISDAEPSADTFLGYRAAPAASLDPLRDAIDRARAARTALRELDGTLPDQPLAVTLARGDRTVTEPSTLEAAAFAIGRHCLIAALDDPTLPHQLAAVLRGHAPAPWHGPTPFVCVSVGDDPIHVARHGHRRAWRAGRGPWLGLGRAGELATVSTCHLVVDGYGHACLTGRIHALTAEARAAERPARTTLSPLPYARSAFHPLPPLPPVAGVVPLGVAWQELAAPSLRALPLAYAAGRILHRAAQRPDARFSPTLQIPIAPGRPDDPERRRRRAMPAAVSVRFEGGVPEPYDTFAARARTVLERETRGEGLCARLVAAARAAPTPLTWKRRGFSTSRPRWLDRIADVLGGRACLSRIRIDAPIPPSCAVSSPSRYASPTDPLGACVITVVDDGTRAAITVCGSGIAGTDATARSLLEELLALTATPVANPTRNFNKLADKF